MQGSVPNERHAWQTCISYGLPSQVHLAIRNLVVDFLEHYVGGMEDIVEQAVGEMESTALQLLFGKMFCFSQHR